MNKIPDIPLMKLMLPKVSIVMFQIINPKMRVKGKLPAYKIGSRRHGVEKSPKTNQRQKSNIVSSSTSNHRKSGGGTLVIQGRRGIHNNIPPKKPNSMGLIGYFTKNS